MSEISMNRKVIEVVLLAGDEETDLLRFSFEETPLDVNLNEESNPPAMLGRME